MLEKKIVFYAFWGPIKEVKKVIIGQMSHLFVYLRRSGPPLYDFVLVIFKTMFFLKPYSLF